MTDLTLAIRRAAARLLAEQRVALVLGYEAGSVPFRTAPAFVERLEDVERLVWGPFCHNNLAVYLPRLRPLGRIALVAKGCDARSAVTLIQEHQLPREQVVILGVPCTGMVDVEQLRSGDGTLAGVRVVPEADGRLTVESSEGRRSLDPQEALEARCRGCEHPTPALADELLGEPGASQPADSRADLGRLERGSPGERQAFWRAHFARCLRCYACRQACPACYCRSCFTDKPAPRWVSKASTVDENWMFHAVRAFHLAGRCVGCGECERVCPTGIPLSGLTRLLDRDVRARFGYAAGLDPEVVPPLGTFRPDDPDPAGHGA